MFGKTTLINNQYTSTDNSKYRDNTTSPFEFLRQDDKTQEMSYSTVSKGNKINEMQ